MRLEEDIKLDYKDVLIRPKRSTLASRSQVDLDRRFLFKNFEPDFYHGSWKDYHYDGIPIMAANMDGVGTFEIAKKLASMKLFTCLTKTYSKSEIVNFFQSGPDDLTEHVAVSIGISEADLEKFRAIYKQITIGLKYVCIDVANGYSERFVEFVQNFRKTYPSLVIIAGNVVTREMTEQLILSGADIVKVGIGPGCFLPGTIVNTTSGPKPIEEVQVGDIVKTHTGAEKPVIDTLVYNNTKPIISINGIKSTDTHEYYVLHKKYKDVVTDDNIHDFAEWVEAKDLTKDYLLLKHK